MQCIYNFAMKFSRKETVKISIIYSLILIFANILGILISSTIESPGGHIKRTSECVRIFVNKLKNTEQYKKYSDSFYQSVVRAAPMHDLGKIAVDDAVLRKPGKLSGNQIPFEARIMALADVFDVLVSRRCYKDSFSYDKAFQIIEESLGSHFDPELGKIFIQCRPQLEELYNTYQAE